MSTVVLLPILIACHGAPYGSTDGAPPRVEPPTPQKSAPLSVDPTLQPYVDALKQELGSDVRRRIATSSQDELIWFHHGLGTAIRNRWLWGSRDERLIAHFRARGIDHPDEMSMEILRALWAVLQSELSEQERQRAALECDLRQRKRHNYDRLSRECQANLERDSTRLASCFERFGPASGNPVSKVPFRPMIVGADGSVRRIDPFEGGNREAKSCLAEIVRQHRFSSFDLDAELTVHVMDLPYCRVSEIDNLHP